MRFFYLYRALKNLLCWSKNAAFHPNLGAGIVSLAIQRVERGVPDGFAQSAEDGLCDLVSLAYYFRGVLCQLLRGSLRNSSSTPHRAKAGIRG